MFETREEEPTQQQGMCSPDLSRYEVADNNSVGICISQAAGDGFFDDILWMCFRHDWAE